MKSQLNPKFFIGGVNIITKIAENSGLTDMKNIGIVTLISKDDEFLITCKREVPDLFLLR